MNRPRIVAFSRTRGSPVAPPIQERCIDRLVDCHERVPTGMTPPTVSFDLRGTTAGQAFPGKNHIRFNGQLLNENTDHFIEHIVGHEWAHLAAAHLHGHAIRAHGLEWKSVMHKLGLTPTRCHVYTTQKARTVKPKMAPRSRKATAMRTMVSTRNKRVPPRTGSGAPRRVFMVPIDAVPASAVMLAYARRLAAKKGLTLSPVLVHSQALLVQWIGLARRK